MSICVMNRIENTVDITNKFSISNLSAMFVFNIFLGLKCEYIKNLWLSILFLSSHSTLSLFYFDIRIRKAFNVLMML